MIIVTILVLIVIAAIGYLIWVLFDIRKINHQLEFINHQNTNQQLQLNSRNPQIVLLSQQVNELIEQHQQVVQESIQSKNQLDLAIHNISHDLRTPLTVASGYTQVLLEDKGLEENQREQLVHLNDNLNNLTKHLDLLLLYNRLLENRVTVNKKNINVSDLLQQLVLGFYDALEQQQINVNLQIEPHILWQMDEEVFTRIVQNMIGNVLDHGFQSAKISLQQQNQQLILQIDNQLAKPIKNPQNLIDRFYTEDLSRKKQNAGLGLHIISQLAQLSDGELTIKTSGLKFSTIVQFNQKTPSSMN